jgi:hypothetical protein
VFPFVGTIQLDYCSSFRKVFQDWKYVYTFENGYLGKQTKISSLPLLYRNSNDILMEKISKCTWWCGWSQHIFLVSIWYHGMNVNLDNILILPSILYCFNTGVLFFRVWGIKKTLIDLKRVTLTPVLLCLSNIFIFPLLVNRIVLNFLFELPFAFWSPARVIVSHLYVYMLYPIFLAILYSLRSFLLVAG